MKKLKRKFKFILIAIIVMILISLITFITCIKLTPKITLKNNDIIKVPVGTTFKEPGYKAYINNKDITSDIKISSNLDTKKIGKYLISYEIKYGIFSDTKLRIIEVVDEEAPKLELKGNEEVTVCPNTTYKEDGYTVTDNYDTDLSSKVIRNESTEKIIYEVADSSGNKTIKTRKITYKDTEPPKLQLSKQNEVIYVNSTYKESSYTATDNCDGNITNKVKVTGSVNSTKIGTYKIIYEVTDSSGNKVTKTRTVQVINRPSNERGVIYLTFDDGPSATITAKVLDILKEEGVLATFFVINHSNNLNYLIKREHDEGHTVALHSYTHDYKAIYQSKANYFQDLEKIQQKVKQITGVESFIIRFPGGSSNTISRQYRKGIMSDLTGEVIAKGYRYYDWNVSSGDAGGAKSSEDVYRNVISSLSINRENIVLMHDFENSYYTLNALRSIIRYGKENGYKFKKITTSTTMVTHPVNN